jgi:hypothetical protein
MAGLGGKADHLPQEIGIRGLLHERAQVHQKGTTEQDAPWTDFDAQARAWLNDVVVASLEAAKAEVASEVTVDIDTAPRRRVKASTPLFGSKSTGSENQRRRSEKRSRSASRCPSSGNLRQLAL